MTKYDVFKRGRALLDKHGLSDWSVCVDSLTRSRRAGQCRPLTKEIGVSQFFIDDMTDMEELGVAKANGYFDNLLLHEIAHSLTPGAAHRLPWKQKYTDLLVQHFGEQDAATYLLQDRYCHDRVDQLLGREHKMSGICATCKRQLVLLKHGCLPTHKMNGERCIGSGFLPNHSFRWLNHG